MPAAEDEGIATYPGEVVRPEEAIGEWALIVFI